MGWDIDETMWFKVRDGILKDRYAGCTYSMADSFSPVIINHRGSLPLEDRHAIVALFPAWIRVEFQEVGYEGEQVILNGRGDFIASGMQKLIVKALIKYLGLIDPQEEVKIKEYEKDKDGNWIPNKIIDIDHYEVK